MGILVCGLNGVGKTTLGKALAEKLGYHFIDMEDLSFAETDGSDPYACPRPREEVKGLLMQEVKACENFVLVAVKGNYGQELLPFIQLVVVIEVPKEVRLQRVKSRSFQKFGSRMLPGGDLYQKEQDFFEMAASRPETYTEEWVRTLNCPVIRVDGAKTIRENTEFIAEQLKMLRQKGETQNGN